MARDRLPHSRGLRRLADKLGFRITFLLALALFPLALLSAVQTVSLSDQAQSRAEAAILGDTVRVAAPVLQHILRAQGSAATLASAVAQIGTDPEQCRNILEQFALNNPLYSLVAFIPPSGKMDCSGSGQNYDFSNSAGFKDAIADPNPTFEVNSNGPVSGTAVLGVIQPVLAADGHRIGIISLSIPQHALEDSAAAAAAEGQSDSRPPMTLFTFDGDGNVLTSSDGIEKDKPLLPRYRTLISLAGSGSLAFTARAANGEKRIFAVVPIVNQKLYALSSWPASAAQTDGTLARLPPLVLPALMAVVSLFAAWMAAEHLVLRHIRRLRHSIRAFAGGSRLVPSMSNRRAPLEIREVQDSFERMTETILHDEAELEDAVHQKEVLLREVHHRIKNNLQLIASIMNMQMRHEKSPEVRAVMKNVQDRVMSLATIHRGLYQTTGVIDVRADELLSDIVRQVVNFSTGPGRKFDVHTDISDLKLTPDQAVPLSLLLTEALTNAMKYANTVEGVAKLSVVLHRVSGDGAVLEIANSLAPEAETDTAHKAESTGFGSQLIRAFSQQLGGDLQTEVADATYTLRLAFAVTPLSEAEERVGAEQAETSDTDLTT